jgi:hypothetical protein
MNVGPPVAALWRQGGSEVVDRIRPDDGAAESLRPKVRQMDVMVASAGDDGFDLWIHLPQRPQNVFHAFGEG